MRVHAGGNLVLIPVETPYREGHIGKRHTERARGWSDLATSDGKKRQTGVLDVSPSVCTVGTDLTCLLTWVCRKCHKKRRARKVPRYFP